MLICQHVFVGMYTPAERGGESAAYRRGKDSKTSNLLILTDN